MEPFAFIVLVPLGKFRKFLQATLLRHLASSDSMILFRYASSALRLSSVRFALFTVRQIHDLAGNVAEGAF
jgi:hypothetical protein